MAQSRIDSECWYTNTVSTKVKREWKLGILRSWSTDHEEFENGPGHFPVGVIEDMKTGQCHSVHVVLICFGHCPTE